MASNTIDTIIDPNDGTIVVLKKPQYDFKTFQPPPTRGELALLRTHTLGAGEGTVASKTNGGDEAFGELSAEEANENEEDEEVIEGEFTNEEFHFLLSHRQLCIATPYFDSS
jgi:hypothetical protein